MNSDLIRIVSNYVNCSDSTEYSELCNSGKIVSESDAHQLFCLLYVQLRNTNMLDKVFKKHTHVFKSIAYRKMINCNHKLHVAIEAIERLNKLDISYVMLKGLMFKTLYPDPDVRLMTDIDVYVNSKDLDKATRVFESTGYSIDEFKEHECNLYLSHPEGMSIELHHKLFSKSIFSNNNLLDETILVDTEVIEYEGVIIKIPSKVNAIAYALLHMTKHFATTGFGVRQLVDVVLYLDKFNHEISYKNLEYILRTYNVLEFNGYIFRLCNEMFGREYYELGIEIDNMKYNYILKSIMDSGIYGHKNIEQDIESEYLARMQKNNGELGKNISFKMKLLFPSNMQLGKKYRYARNKKYLLPLAWIHRAIANIASENKLSRKMMLNSPDKTKVLERYEILRFFNLQKTKE